MPTDSDLARRRTDAVTRLGLLKRAGDPGLTALARVAAFVTGARAVGVHVLDDFHQHRVAAVRAPLGEHPRQDAMCRLVVDGQQRIVCADATRESRFSYSSFVSGDEPVRFYASIPVRAVNGSVVGTLCAWDTRSFELDGEQLARFEDLAAEVSTRIELTHIATALEYASSRDPLTGAVNRLVLADRLAHAFSRQLRHDLDVLVVAVDIDRFKQINDTYGHDAGDEVLVAVAQRLTASTRPEDTVARLEATFAEPIPIGGEPMVIGVSIGAGFAVPGDDVRDALARADVAMYERKARHGRPSSR